MNAYCDRQSVEMNSIAFLFDGRRLRGEQTPDEVLVESYFQKVGANVFLLKISANFGNSNIEAVLFRSSIKALIVMFLNKRFTRLKNLWEFLIQ